MDKMHEECLHPIDRHSRTSKLVTGAIQNWTHMCVPVCLPSSLSNLISHSIMATMPSKKDH